MLPPNCCYGLFCHYFCDTRHDILRAGQGDRVAERKAAGMVADGFILAAVCRPALGQAHEPFTFQGRKVTDKTVLLFSLIPECEGLTYTGKQSWEGFAVSAETRAETFLIALLSIDRIRRSWKGRTTGTCRPA